MKIFSTSQVKLLDEYTIANEPIASIHLMERAAKRIYAAYLKLFDAQNPVLIVAGPGNNGGDAMALARMLVRDNFQVSVVLINELTQLTSDCETNLRRLNELAPHCVKMGYQEAFLSTVKPNTIIVDGLFGSGLNRPLKGEYAQIVNWINKSNCIVVAIDIPSGLNGDSNTDFSQPIVKAKHCFSLQFPKLACMMPDCAEYLGEWTVLDIQLHPQAIANTQSQYSYIEANQARVIRKARSKFSHKGTYGHLLIVAGSQGMAGAAVLAAKAAMRAGAGLLTVTSPECNRLIVQTALPEAIFKANSNPAFIATLTHQVNQYSCVAIGPGIGTQHASEQALESLCKQITKPAVFDADALNIIANNPSLLQKIPVLSILTPHPKEFDRLFGPSQYSIQRVQLATQAAQKHGLIIVLKGAHTLIALPDGQCVFNSTGNPGMATAGSGDVLTGIIAGLLSQGYEAHKAAILGAYIHGLAADIALKDESVESLIASDIIKHLGKAFKQLSM